MSKFYVVRGPGSLPARAIISRVCAARRSAGNGRSVSKAVPLFTSPIRRFSRGLCFSFAPSTASKRWHLSCLLLSVTKEVRPTAAGRKIPRRKQKSDKLFLDSSFCERRIPPAGCRKKKSLNPKKSRSVFHIIVENLSAFPPQTKNSKNPPPASQNQTKKRPPLCRIPGSSSGLFQTVSNIQN